MSEPSSINSRVNGSSQPKEYQPATKGEGVSAAKATLNKWL